MKRVALVAVLLAGVVVVAVRGGSPHLASAATEPRPAELVSVREDGSVSPNAVRIGLSSLGDVASFESDLTDDGGRIRVRPNATTAVPTPQPVANHNISDDGCVIAYANVSNAVILFLRGRQSAVPLYAYNRCTGTSTLLGDAGTGGDAPPPPGLSANGSVIAFALRDVVRVFRISGGTVTSTTLTVANGLWPSEVDLSDDGNTVVVAAAPRGQGSAASNVYVIDVASAAVSLASKNAAGSPLGASVNPTISGDGTLVAFSRPTGVLVYDRSVDVVRGPFIVGFEPRISRDGHHIAALVDDGNEAPMVWASYSNNRWQSFAPWELVSYGLAGTPPPNGWVREAAIADHGRWVGWISTYPNDFVADPRLPVRSADSQAFVRERRPVLSIAALDFGNTPTAFNMSTTVTNIGPSGWVVTGFDTTGDFSVQSENCAAVVHPGEVCMVTVRFNGSAGGLATGTLNVRDNSYPGIPLTATGTLRGTFDPGAPAPTTTQPPVVTQPPPARVGLDITPDPVVFDSTVVGVAAAGRTATVRNTGQVNVAIQNVSIGGAHAADFTVAGNACAGATLAPSQTCAVDLGFTPSEFGNRLASVVVTGSGGTSASAALRGPGRYDAVLEVLPQVAAGGQVVTVTGRGYPANASVGVTVGGSPPAIAATDPAGGFQIQWLILEGTPQGTLDVDDVATAAYDALPVPLQVVLSPARPQGQVSLQVNTRSYLSR